MEQIGPYRVVEEIARGGAGVVFRAQGPGGETVALKLLLEQAAVSPRARQRFQSEIKAQARLRHPNVVAILDEGEHRGAPWLALEFVEGESLEARLRGGPLPLPEVLRLGRQLALALGYVHSCGLLHRDLKPANVLLRDDQALLTDFGLVRDDQEQSQGGITASGVFLGTPGYWAPEQAAGEQAKVGVATDVYGLGAVLYACLTGQAPVEASSLAEYLQPERFRRIAPPRRLRPEVPVWLSELCMRCLRADPAERPQAASEVARALVLGPGGAAETAGPRARFRRGPLAAALTAALALALLGGSLLVRSDPGAAARARGERSLAEFRWDDAAAAFSEALALNPADAEALLGRAEARTGPASQREAALADVQRALELAPNSSRAYVSRGILHEWLGQRELALADLDRALELDPSSIRAYTNRGGIRAHLGDAEGALDDLTRALELDPRSAQAYVSRGAHLANLGRFEDAARDFERAEALTPNNLLLFVQRGIARSNAGRKEEALADFSRALELAPDDLEARLDRASIYVDLGRNDLALEDYDRALESHPRSARALYKRGGVMARLGREEDAVADFTRALTLDPELAEAYAGRGGALARLGRNAEGLADLNRALELDPKISGGLRNLGAVLANLGRYDDALRAFDRALELPSRDATAYSLRAFVLTALGRDAEAVGDYGRALEIDPEVGDWYLQRGKALIRLQRWREALADLDRALTKPLSPSSADFARRQRDALLAQLGE
ncbi:MAG: tetratricopeptide repeat protein [Planctomycetes bacterium]|nr:tetratricopeptide repeat protein [Planctomycetota bacterium]